MAVGGVVEVGVAVGGVVEVGVAVGGVVEVGVAAGGGGVETNEESLYVVGVPLVSCSLLDKPVYPIFGDIWDLSTTNTTNCMHANYGAIFLPLSTLVSTYVHTPD